MAPIKIFTTLAAIANMASAVYFQAEPDVWRCFKDTIVGNYVSSSYPNRDRLLKWKPKSSTTKCS